LGGLRGKEYRKFETGNWNLKIGIGNLKFLVVQPLRGWGVFVCFPRLRRGLFIFNPFGVVHNIYN